MKINTQHQMAPPTDYVHLPDPRRVALELIRGRFQIVDVASDRLDAIVRRLDAVVRIDEFLGDRVELVVAVREVTPAERTGVGDNFSNFNFNQYVIIIMGL